MQAYLVNLQEGKDLTEVELIEKEMVQAWTALVHRHKVTTVNYED